MFNEHNEIEYKHCQVFHTQLRSVMLILLCLASFTYLFTSQLHSSANDRITFFLIPLILYLLIVQSKVSYNVIPCITYFNHTHTCIAFKILLPSLILQSQKCSYYFHLFCYFQIGISVWLILLNMMTSSSNDLKNVILLFSMFNQNIFSLIL